VIVLLLLVLLVVPQPAAAQSPAPAGTPLTPERIAARQEEDESRQIPIERYYHQVFFGQPWRTPGMAAGVGIGAAKVIAAALALFLVRDWRRRHR